jgi:hypothetical protein
MANPFLVPYEDMLDLLDTLQELKDTTLLQEIARARDEYAGGKEVTAERLFRKRGVPYRVSRASRRPAP